MVREMLVPALDKFIIMDDVTLTDETDTFGTVALEGPNAAEIAKKLTSINLGDLKDLSFQETVVAGISCALTKRSPGGVAGAEFLSTREDLPRLWRVLREAVESAGGTPIGYKALNALRLEQGIPWLVTTSATSRFRMKPAYRTRTSATRKAATPDKKLWNVCARAAT